MLFLKEELRKVEGKMWISSSRRYEKSAVEYWGILRNFILEECGHNRTNMLLSPSLNRNPIVTVAGFNATGNVPDFQLISLLYDSLPEDRAVLDLIASFDVTSQCNFSEELKRSIFDNIFNYVESRIGV